MRQRRALPLSSPVQDGFEKHQRQDEAREYHLCHVGGWCGWPAVLGCRVRKAGRKTMSCAFAGDSVVKEDPSCLRPCVPSSRGEVVCTMTAPRQKGARRIITAESSCMHDDSAVMILLAPFCLGAVMVHTTSPRELGTHGRKQLGSSFTTESPANAQDIVFRPAFLTLQPKTAGQPHQPPT